MKENTWISSVDFELDIKTRWGDWSYDRKNLTLFNSEGYEVDLTECNSAAEILDWIFQVAGKSWADNRTVTTLIEALEDLLDPQANVCSWGRDKHFNSTQWLRGNNGGML